jgi:hypothetical protein
MNTITLELSKADRETLEGLRAAINLLSTVIGNTQPKAVQEQIIAELTAESTPAPAAEPDPVAETAPEVKPISLAEFQKAVTLAVSKGDDAKKATKEIINKYAASVSAVPEDKRAEAMAELANI